MAWAQGESRLATDYGFVGGVVGFITSLVQFVVLMGLAWRIDRGEGSVGRLGCTCVLRLLALLGLTLGTGVGYMIARAIAG